MRPIAAGCLALLVLAAGCLLDPTPAPEAPDGEQREPPEPDDPSPAGDDGDEGSAPAPLASPPAWVPGEYWRIRVDSTLLDEPVEWTRVVAGVGPEAYRVGQPAEAFSVPGLLLHVPGLGEVARQNLSYSVHGSTFTPLVFPLEDGQSWRTRFEGDPVNATVETRGDGTARVRYCCSRNVTATYDPAVKAITNMTVDDGLIRYEVTEHGFGHDTPVRVSLDRRLVFLDGRTAGVLDDGGGPGPPTGEAEVPEDVDRVAFTQIVGNLDLVPGPETGAYVERATHPDGSTFQARQAASTDGLEVRFRDVPNATGTWRFEHAAAGPGLAFTEGVGYRALERRPT